jgi:anti-sigma-K factor RskA
VSALAHADLSGLLRGALGNDEVALTGAHVRGCPSCRQDLVETAVGHALLAHSAQVLGPEQPGEPSPAPTVAQLLASLPAERSHRPGLRLMAVAAALVGAAGVGAAVHARTVEDGTPEPDRSASLLALGGTGGGTVAMTELPGPSARTAMRISTHDLPDVARGQFYYAWLLDPATNKMLPLGQVGPSGTASFEVSDALLAAYSAVDVSLEVDDGNPQHSPTSVLRASYA